MNHDFLNSANDILKNLDISLHSKIENSFVDNLLHELQSYLTKLQSASLLNTLPEHTILIFAKYDANFAVCFDYNEKKIYYVPQENIEGNKPEPGEPLKTYSSGKFYVDYTGIPVEEDKIEDYLHECEIAK